MGSEVARLVNGFMVAHTEPIRASMGPALSVGAKALRPGLHVRRAIKELRLPEIALASLEL